MCALVGFFQSMLVSWLYMIRSSFIYKIVVSLQGMGGHPTGCYAVAEGMHGPYLARTMSAMHGVMCMCAWRPGRARACQVVGAHLSAQYLYHGGTNEVLMGEKVPGQVHVQTGLRMGMH